MEEDVPRRLRRFQKRGETPERQKPRKTEKTDEYWSPEREEAEAKEKTLQEIDSEDEIQRDLREKKKRIILKETAGLEKSIDEVDSEEEISDNLAKQMGEGKRSRAKEIAKDEIESFKGRHNRLPMRSEYDQLVENIFSQIQDEERKNKGTVEVEKTKETELKQVDRRERRRHRDRREEETEEKAPEENTRTKSSIEGMDVKDLLNVGGNEKSGGGEDISGLGGDEDFKIPSIEDEEGKCKNCGKKADKKYYCPECGAQFCDKCTKSQRQLGTQVELECPACGKKIKK